MSRDTIGGCTNCDNPYPEHTIARPDEVETLRNLGYEVIVCETGIQKDLLFAEGEHLWVWAEKDGVAVTSGNETVLEICRNAEPGDPCDSDFMEDISS